MQVTLNTRVPINIAKALDDYAQASGKSKAAIVAAALQKYLDQHQLPEKERATMTLREFLIDTLGDAFPEALSEGELEQIGRDLDESIERRFVMDDSGYTATAVLAGCSLCVDLKSNHFVYSEDELDALLAGEMFGDGWEEI